jgi:hypothetical protein
MLRLPIFLVGTQRPTISMTKGQRLVPLKYLLRSKHNNNNNNNNNSPFIYLWLYSHLLDLGGLFSFLIFDTVCRTPWTGDQPFAKPLSAHRTTQTQNKYLCLKWDWNRRSQCLSGRRHERRPLWSAITTHTTINFVTAMNRESQEQLTGPVLVCGRGMRPGSRYCCLNRAVVQSPVIYEYTTSMEWWLWLAGGIQTAWSEKEDASLLFGPPQIPHGQPTVASQPLGLNTFFGVS